jgi:hypothetical protein
MRRSKSVVGVGVGVAAVVSVVSVWAATAGTAAPSHAGSPAKVAVAGSGSAFDAQLAAARAATAKYVTDLGLAKKNGYRIITRMIPTMGYHFMNPNVKGFDVTKPPILVYEHSGTGWQLGALEWVFTSKPAKPPLPGAHYGAFGAGCHYVDGTFVPSTSQDACPNKDPQTGAAFSFWHPNLVTLHVWLWYPNPSGLFASTNPLVSTFNQG